MGNSAIKDYPLYVTSYSKPTQILFIFRDNGQQIKVTLTGDQPVGDYPLTPEERIHILEHFYKKERDE